MIITFCGLFCIAVIPYLLYGYVACALRVARRGFGLALLVGYILFQPLLLRLFMPSSDVPRGITGRRITTYLLRALPRAFTNCLTPTGAPRWRLFAAAFPHTH